MNNIDMIKARIRDLENKLERLYNGEIRLRSGKPVKNPEGFFWIWTGELNELNDFILKTI